MYIVSESRLVCLVHTYQMNRATHCIRPASYLVTYYWGWNLTAWLPLAKSK